MLPVGSRKTVSHETKVIVVVLQNMILVGESDHSACHSPQLIRIPRIQTFRVGFVTDDQALQMY